MTTEQKDAPKPVLAQPQVNKPQMAPSEIVTEKAPDTPVMKADPKGIAPKGPVLPADRVPSNWNILPTEVEDQIHASNIHTGKVFQGTRKELSAYMRSE